MVCNKWTTELCFKLENLPFSFEKDYGKNFFKTRANSVETMSEETSTKNQKPLTGRGSGLKLFQKGNPGGPGRPKKVWTAQELYEKRVKSDLRAAAKEFSPQALKTLVDIMNNETVAAQHRISAANSILDRSHGKPTSNQEISVGVYERMSDRELISFLTGKDITGDVIEHNSSADDSSNDDYSDGDEGSSNEDESTMDHES